MMRDHGRSIRDRSRRRCGTGSHRGTDQCGDGHGRGAGLRRLGPLLCLPDLLVDARQTCTPKGRCKVGWIVSRGGRESFDVWLEVATGLVKLIRQAEA
jgi:hypothetical protein